MSQMKQANSWNSSSKEYKYYLFYLKEDGSLYAYTNQKILAKAFHETREKSIFIYREKMLTSSDLKEIYEETPDTLIEAYKFHFFLVIHVKFLRFLKNRHKKDLMDYIISTKSVSAWYI